MKKHLFILCLITIGFSGSCLAQASKWNPGFAKKYFADKNSNELIHFLVKGNPAAIKAEVTRLGGSYQCAAGDINSVIATVKIAGQLVQSRTVQRLEYDPQPLVALSDTMVVLNNLVKVYNGDAPLTQSYDGTGVIMGIIDTGIDFYHPDFRDANGTRLLYLWDQNSASLPHPSGFSYGSEWTANDINTGVAHNPNGYPNGTGSQYGHGTFVASIAAGDGDTCGIHKGVARKSPIIFVANDLSNTARIVDAVSYIFSKADALGKPCVINISLGEVYGSHDGKDLVTQGVDALITQKSGRSVVCASGDYGLQANHLGYTVSATDTLFTWIEKGVAPHPILPYCFAGIWADSADFVGVKFAVGADNKAPFEFRGLTNFRTIGSFTPGVADSTYLTNTNNDTLCKVVYYPDLVGGVYSIEIAVFPDSTNYYYRIMTTGTGKFDAYGWDGYTSNWVPNGNLPSAVTYPPMAHYVRPDSTQNITSGFQCSDKVITVGAYLNRAVFKSAAGSMNTFFFWPPGQIWNGSSVGPTRTGKVKPDISSPGQRIMAALPIVTIAGSNQTKLDSCRNHTVGNGTSFSSPNVAGIVALYLQFCPNANWQEIKDQLIHTALVDTFTTHAVPNNIYGWGKADAFAMISTGICSNGISDNKNSASLSHLEIFPNPSDGETVVRYNLPPFKSGERGMLIITDQLGRKIQEQILITPEGSKELHHKDFVQGIYVCTIYVNDKALASQKMIIVK